MNYKERKVHFTPYFRKDLDGGEISDDYKKDDKQLRKAYESE